MVEKGERCSDSPSGVALRGHARASSGQTTGIVDRTVSDSDGATGVQGEATATSGETTGVRGQVESDSDGATAVEGEATAASGATYGVEAITQSDDGNAAAVRADAPNGGRGIEATASSNYAINASTTDFPAVNATSYAPNSNAVAARNTATTG